MRILIVDDSKCVLMTLRCKLEDLGHEVLTAADGMQAWDLLQADPVRLIITDWMMPNLSGLDLCRQVRAKGLDPYTYVVLLTSKQLRKDELEGLDAGADDFLVKPVDIIELKIALARAKRILDALGTLEERVEELRSRDAGPVMTTMPAYRASSAPHFAGRLG